MKRYIHGIILTMAALGSLALSSCIKDDVPNGGNELGDGQPVSISLNAFSPLAAPLATDPGSTLDQQIKQLRILVYDSNNGELKYNFYIPQEPDVPNIALGRDPYRLDLVTGTYTFVFVANETPTSALNNDDNIATFTKLRNLFFGCTEFYTAQSDTNGIPMVREFDRVKITGENQVVLNGQTTAEASPWLVDLERAGIRIRLNITMTAGQAEQIGTNPNAFTITGGLPPSSYVLAGRDNTPDDTQGNFACGAPTSVSDPDDDNNVTYTFERIILPELVLTGNNNVEANALQLELKYGSYDKTAILKPDDAGDDWSLPRNTFLDVSGSVTKDAIEIKAKVLPWGDGDGDYTFDGEHYLKTDQDEYYFNAYGGTQSLNIDTNQPGGWTLSGDVSASTIVSSDGKTITMSPLSGSTAKNPNIVIIAGNLRKTIHIRQYPPTNAITDNVLPNSYVGAFWRSNQQGERLIRIPRPADGRADGKWVAIVLEGEDWIHLDTEMTTDTNVGWLTGNADATPDDPNTLGSAFDTEHNVTGNLKYVTGDLEAPTGDGADPNDGYIYFRIGLNGFYTPTTDAPARYGVILLAYKGGGNTAARQRIWIRQGEDADYLFRPQDASPTDFGGDVARPVAVKFATRNLTAKKLNVPADATYSSNPAENTGDNPTLFADYPSQAGAYWQWASVASPRIAYDAFSSAAPSVWDTQANINSAWDVVSNSNETCPVGYRRPTDGPDDTFYTTLTGTVLAQSEMRQSLLAAPDTGVSNAGMFAQTNLVQGYYADGFFDRRLIGRDPLGQQAAYAVSASNAQVAFTGMLVYNIDTYASLFLPQVGYRIGSGAAAPGTGALDGTVSNNDIHYWSASSFNNGQRYTMRGYPPTNSAQAIRCVVDTPPVAPPLEDIVDVPADINAVIPYIGAFWKAEQTGERLIHMDRPSGTADDAVIDGEWIAQVIDVNDGLNWITLDKQPSNDSNIGWVTGSSADPDMDGNDLGFDGVNPVGGTSYVSGTLNAASPRIYFRIGLKSQNTSGKPRYGLVLLRYGGNDHYSQRIWIRQGEQDDYVMRPEDAFTDGLLEGEARTAAVKWSPYNLTATYIATSLSSPQTDTHAYSYGNPPLFTVYPTMAGALFEQSESYVQAWSPILRLISFCPENLSFLPWNTAYETCPNGYRRPTCGPINATRDIFNSDTPEADARVSEMEQSLWLAIPDVSYRGQSSRNTPMTNTSTPGYYADGYFDRRKPITPTYTLSNGMSGEGLANSAVETDTNNIAYGGRIVYNPDNCASLFFPFAGIRNSNSDLSMVGSVGYYMSSSYNWETNNSAYEAPLNLSINRDFGEGKEYFGIQLNASTSSATPIRCVKDE